jgi:hypothetical protein
MGPEDEPDELGPDPDANQWEEQELYESERNFERILDYLDLLNASDVDETGTFEAGDMSITFTVKFDDPPQEFPGFACLVRDAWVDVCLIRDWSSDVRVKFRDRAADIFGAIGLHGVSLSFLPDEDTVYMTHRVFAEGLNFDVFRACIWSLLSAQSRVAAILDRER